MTLPAPLVSAETDVRDLDGFMLNVERMLASELWALSTPAEFKAAFALWMRAWKQYPAGSLPDDERVLAAFSGAGRRWAKVRDMALRGFIKCADGRLYHKTLCEDVVRAFAKKMARRDRTSAATKARKSSKTTDRNDNRNDPPKVDVTTTQGQGQGQGQVREDPAPTGAGADGLDIPDFLRREAAKSPPAPELPLLAPTRVVATPAGPLGSTEPIPVPAPSPTAIDIKRGLFQSGIDFLMAGVAGMTEKKARAVIGRWRQLAGDATMIDVLSACTGKAPSDPIAWIEAAIRHRRKNGNGSHHDDVGREDSLAVLRAFGRVPADAEPGAGDGSGAGLGSGGAAKA